MRPPIEVLWSPSPQHNRVNGWTFPVAVERHLRELTKGRSVLQLFGGLSKWGIRLDIDPETRPHVIGNAWLPPFIRNAVDVVILDPPYVNLNQQTRCALLRAAAYVARDYLVWFHTVWTANYGLVLERSWLVRVGANANVRCIQLFRIPRDKPVPRLGVTRGPALKYNRWIRQGGLPLDHHAAAAPACD